MSNEGRHIRKERSMKIQRLLIVLTILNALLLVILLTKPPAATAQEATSVLRAHSL